jgi:hypothetical protein
MAPTSAFSASRRICFDGHLADLQLASLLQVALPSHA